ncbi:MAG: hypothetical protein ACD_73C00772G0003 [uncultured bacterium]|nr:MAG: hypothetical protein ACD_73C00772G0003 [uncultured bacterium]
MKKLKIIFILFFLFLASSVQALDVPYLVGHVNDYAHLLSSQTVSDIEQLLKSHEKRTGNQIVVLTIAGLEGEVLEDYSMRVVEKWKLGQKEKDNGVLLLVAAKDRKLRIEVGYGLEDYLTDALSQQIIKNVIVPQFKQGNYDKGIENGMFAIVKVVRGEIDSDDLQKSQDNLWGQVMFYLLVMIGMLVWFYLLPGALKRNRMISIASLWGGGSFSGGGFSGGGGSFGGGGSSGSW